MGHDVKACNEHTFSISQKIMEALRFIPQPHRLAKRLLVYYHVLRCATTCLYGYSVEMVTILVPILNSTSIPSVNNVLEVGIFSGNTQHAWIEPTPTDRLQFSDAPKIFTTTTVRRNTTRTCCLTKDRGYLPLPPRFQEPSRAATNVRHASNSCEAHHLNIVTSFTDRYDTWCHPTRMLLNHII